MPTSLEKTIAVGLIATSFLTLWATLITPILDGDIWFHLLYGKAILEQHSLIPDHTVYSWTPSTNATIYCAWIGQVFYYLLYTHLGETGVVAFRFAAATIPLLAIYHLARQRGTFYHPITSLTAVSSIPILSLSIFDKPEILSLVFMTLLVWNWFQIKGSGRNKLFHIYLFPLVILIWVNTHGVFTFGCIFLLIAGFGETCNQVLYTHQALTKKEYTNLIASLVISFLCIFITPYGFEYIHQLIFSFFEESNLENINHVNAWKSTFSVPNFRITYSANFSVIFVAIVLFVALIRRNIDFVPVIANIVFAYYFTVYGRLMYFWTPVFALSIIYYSNNIKFYNLSTNKYFVNLLYLFIIISSAYILLLQYKYPPREGWLTFEKSEYFTLDDEINFIQHNYQASNLGTFYNHGAYILWKSWPGQKVMIDARYFPYKEWFPKYIAFEHGTGIESFIQAHPFDVIEIPHIFYNTNRWFARSPDWKPVFYGKAAIIYSRSATAPSAPLQRGTSLAKIQEFSIATAALHTTLLIKDWQGYQQLLSDMKTRFTKREQQEITSGMALIRPATIAYDRGDYPATVKLCNLATEWKGGYPPLLSAGLLMQGVEEWKKQQWKDAVHYTMRALFAQESVAATYNLAIMAWQLETMQKEGKTIPLELSEEENNILRQWRKALQQLTEKESPPQYMMYIINAKNILRDQPGAQVNFMTVDWL